MDWTISSESAIANVDILNGHVTHVARLIVLHDRFTRREEALGVGVALRRGQIADHVDQDFVRGVETERGRLPMFSFRTLLPFFFKTFSFFLSTGPRMS